ncbi:MAG: DUF975 family protein [Defluviitaleaceae bacterium]|nr:DUF975 family protein [Defluviitaleaceae bacterium]
MKTRQEIKALARQHMGMQRGTSILLGLIVTLITTASGIIDQIVASITGSADVFTWYLYALGLLDDTWLYLMGTTSTSLTIPYLIVFIAGYFVIFIATVNMHGEYIKIYKREKADVGGIFTGFQVNAMRKLGGTLWMTLWVFLWSLLFVIPGIIKGLSYFCTTYILADCPNVTARQALKISMKITKGHKLDLFVFGLSFIGWFILSFFTCFILYIVYVGPYYYTASAGYYVEMRDKALADGRITREDLGWDEVESKDEDEFGFAN